MRCLVCFAFVLLTLVCTGQVQASAPPDFLQTNVPAMNRVLSGKILENFYKVNPVDAARRLGELGGVKVIFDVPDGRSLPLFTRKLHLVTLRDAFYIVSQDSGLKVEWYYVGRLPQAVKFSQVPANTQQQQD